MSAAASYQAPPALISTRHVYDSLFSIYVPIAAGVFVIVILATLVMVVRGTRRRPRPGEGRSENNRLEVTYALILACVVSFLIFETLVKEHQVDTASARERPSLTVNVIGARWEWQFGYPAYGFSVFSGAAARQAVLLPAGVPIRFQLHAVDVIHDFWVPELNYKHDVFPGITQDVTLTFDRPGRYAGQCAQFCGLLHSEMIFDVEAVPPARFRAWAASHHGGAGAGTLPAPSSFSARRPTRGLPT